MEWELMDKNKSNLKRPIITILAIIMISSALTVGMGRMNVEASSNVVQEEPLGTSEPPKPLSPAITTRSVLVELFTGTWCPPCQGAEGALDRLADEYPRTQLSILEWHDGDSFDPPDGSGDDRWAYYVATSGWFPSAWFDGMNTYIGGSSDPDSPTTYTDYKNNIDNALASPSRFTITVNGSLDDPVPGQATVNANITQIDDTLIGNLHARFVVYEDHNYSYYISGREYRLRHTVVKTLPEEALTITKGQSLEFTKTFAIDPAWEVEELGVVVFVQTDDKTPHDYTISGNTRTYYWAEILQSTSYNFSASFVDLTVTPPDITFSNPTPNDGDIVTIYADIHNAGNLNTLNPVTVRFFDGDPGMGGTQIGADQNAGIILSGGTSNVQVDWDTTGKQGTHEIVVMVDPDGAIWETENENNNIAPRRIDVAPSVPKPPYATAFTPTGSGVPVDTNFFVQWSEVMNWNTVNGSFSYTDSITTWDETEGTFIHDPIAETSTFDPFIDLASGVTYTVTFDTTAFDLDWEPLDQNMNGVGGEIGQDELDWSFTTGVDAPPTVEAWDPGGSPGQIYTVGEWVQVEWIANDNNPWPNSDNVVNISYGMPGSWTPIINNELEDGGHMWDTNGVTPGSYYINISVYDDIGQESWDLGNNTFDIVAGDPPPNIEVWEPGGTSGQTYTQGELIDVMWYADDDNTLPNNPINITYGTPGSWTPIANDEANDGVYVWDTAGVPCPNTYWMNLSVYDSISQTTFDEGNFSFDIVCVDTPPTISVWEPGGTLSQNFDQGNIIQVKWFADDNSPLPATPINISYGVMGSWTPITTDEVNDGIYDWDTTTVPCPDSYWMNLTVYDDAGQETYGWSNFSFSIFCPGDSPPTIAVYEPGGTQGQIYTQGDSVPVTWLATDDFTLPFNPINISYGDSSSGWTPIVNDEADDGYYDWDTSSVPCPDTYKVKISVYDSAGQETSEESNYTFTINCPIDDFPTITVFEPGGLLGQIYTEGDSIQVLWTADDDKTLPPTPINVSYGSGASWTPIVNGEANDGIYDWDTTGVPCPGDYKMKISIYDSAGQENSDESNYSFSIKCDNPPTITVLQPGGTLGQTYTQGDTLTVTWIANDNKPLPSDPINISYGDSGLGWTSIATDEANDGSYNWDTSSVPCDETYKMRLSVYDTKGQTTYGYSTHSFDIDCPGGITTGTITGTVKDSSTVPISGATVTLTDSTSTVIDTKTTDASGGFTFQDCEAGMDEYTITAEKLGYKSDTEGDVDVTAGGITTVNLILEDDATVSGRIVREDSPTTGIGGATVILMDQDGNPVATEETDSDGNFECTGVLYGTYQIYVQSEGFIAETSSMFTVTDDTPAFVLTDTELAPITGPGADDGGGDWWWIILVIIVIAVVAILIVYLLMARKKKGEKEAEEPEAPEPVSEEEPPTV